MIQGETSTVFTQTCSQGGANVKQTAEQNMTTENYWIMDYVYGTWKPLTAKGPDDRSCLLDSFDIYDSIDVVQLDVTASAPCE